MSRKIAGVERSSPRFASPSASARPTLASIFVGVAAGDHHARAGGLKAPRDLEADSAGAADHQRGAARRGSKSAPLI